MVRNACDISRLGSSVGDLDALSRSLSLSLAATRLGSHVTRRERPELGNTHVTILEGVEVGRKVVVRHQVLFLVLLHVSGGILPQTTKSLSACDPGKHSGIKGGEAVWRKKRGAQSR